MTRPALVQVQTATSSPEEAARVGAALLDRRLAACVQVVGPVESRYWWQGELETATEWLCLAKTTADLADAATAAIQEAHSYETPEVVTLPILGGSQGYLDWVAATVAGPREGSV
jgi:periplasmic divalent cation tolerance protein